MKLNGRINPSTGNDTYRPLDESCVWIEEVRGYSKRRVRFESAPFGSDRLAASRIYLPPRLNKYCPTLRSTPLYHLWLLNQIGKKSFVIPPRTPCTSRKWIIQNSTNKSNLLPVGNLVSLKERNFFQTTIHREQRATTFSLFSHVGFVRSGNRRHVVGASVSRTSELLKPESTQLHVNSCTCLCTLRPPIYLSLSSFLPRCSSTFLCSFRAHPPALSGSCCTNAFATWPTRRFCLLLRQHPFPFSYTDYCLPRSYAQLCRKPWAGVEKGGLCHGIELYACALFFLFFRDALVFLRN